MKNKLKIKINLVINGTRSLKNTKHPTAHLGTSVFSSVSPSTDLTIFFFFFFFFYEKKLVVFICKISVFVCLCV